MKLATYNFDDDVYFDAAFIEGLNTSADDVRIVRMGGENSKRWRAVGTAAAINRLKDVLRQVARGDIGDAFNEVDEYDAFIGAHGFDLYDAIMLVGRKRGALAFATDQRLHSAIKATDSTALAYIEEIRRHREAMAAIKAGQKRAIADLCRAATKRQPARVPGPRRRAA